MKKSLSLLVALLVMISFFGFNTTTAFAASQIDVINVSITRTASYPEVKISCEGLTIGAPTYSVTKAQTVGTIVNRFVATFPITVKSGYSLAKPMRYNVTGDGAKNYTIGLKVSNGKGTLSVSVPVCRQLTAPKITWLNPSLPTWNKVDGASSYTIVLYEMPTGKKMCTKTTTKTYIHLDSLVPPGLYRFLIRSNSSNDAYFAASGFLEATISIPQLIAVPKG